MIKLYSYILNAEFNNITFVQLSLISKHLKGESCEPSYSHIFELYLN